MALFLGRQPILDRAQNTYGYELLFRDGPENAFRGSDADQATLTVIDNSLGHMGLRQVTGGKKAFINFTRRLLVEDYGSLLPKEHVVIEVLEGIEPDSEVIKACRRLKDLGYTVALDDFQYRPEYDPLIEIADVIKVDLHVSNERDRQQMARQFLPLNIRLLAERVETFAEFEQVKEMGYSYFQGYFFSRPVVLSMEQVPQSKLARIQLLQLINHPEFDLEKAETIIKHDPSLTMKLLQYINSVIFGLSVQVQSIRQALSLLGEENIRKWIALLVLNGLVEDRPVELLRQAIVRGRFCELLAKPLNLEGKDQELFMTGVFSLLDTMMGKPMADLLIDIPLSKEIEAALLRKSSPYEDALATAKAFERGDWNHIAAVSEKYGTEDERLAACHQEAFSWADEIAPA